MCSYTPLTNIFVFLQSAYTSLPPTPQGTRTPGDLPLKPVFNQALSGHNSDADLPTEHDDDDDEDEDELTKFYESKHKSDKNYLAQLSQIAHNSELKVESNADFSLLKNRRNISSRESSFLYSPPSSNRNTPSRLVTSSKLSNYSGKSGVVIPPADRTMEVVVGKGRRSSMSGSARSNKDLPPQTPTSRARTGTASAIYLCKKCPKKYNNQKDLDIHKMYCS